MKETELIHLIATNMSNITMDRFFSYIANDCDYYSSNKKVASGKDEVCTFFSKRMEAQRRTGVKCFAYPATVTESKCPEVSVGDNCVALAQYDKYNCVGFMTLKTNLLGKIKRFSFHTTPDVTFKTSSPDKVSITRVPRDAGDAIRFRAFASGILDEDLPPDRKLQPDVLRDYAQRVYTYIYRHLNNDFNNGITNAAGYLFVAAMAEAVQQKSGRTLFSFDEVDSVSGRIPDVDAEYRKWIENGYETGKGLFFGFIEYANLRGPKEKVFGDQLLQSFLDMTIYGGAQANKDLEMGVPVSETKTVSELNTAIANLKKDQNHKNQDKLGRVLRSYVTEGKWVHISGEQDDKGFAITVIKCQGKQFGAMYSDESEIRSRNSSIVITDINKVLDAVFSNPNLEGIVIDPDTSSLCLVKPFLLMCLLHWGYPKTNNGGSPQKDWGVGIPEYSQDDLMTQGEIQNFAMHTVIDFEQKLKQDCFLISGCDYPGAMPSLIFGKRDGSFLFLYIKGDVAEEEPVLSFDEKRELLVIGEKYNAKCYWAPVGFRSSSDLMRFNACLALRGDGFYCKYEGLRPVN